MVSRHDATLNLASLIKHDLTAGDEVEGRGLLMPSEDVLAADGLHLATDLSWHITVRSAGGDDDFILTGSVSGVALQECRRCLSEVTIPMRSNFIYPMMFRSGHPRLELIETTEDDEEHLLFGQPEVDFASLLAQVFAIELPLTVLCKSDCKGLAIDGVNLNDYPEHTPGYDTPKVPSPFEVLKDLDL